jgi:hypothetical protein
MIDSAGMKSSLFNLNCFVTVGIRIGVNHFLPGYLAAFVVGPQAQELIMFFSLRFASLSDSFEESLIFL